MSKNNQNLDQSKLLDNLNINQDDNFSGNGGGENQFFKKKRDGNNDFNGRGMPTYREGGNRGGRMLGERGGGNFREREGGNRGGRMLGDRRGGNFGEREGGNRGGRIYRGRGGQNFGGGRRWPFEEGGGRKPFNNRGRGRDNRYNQGSDREPRRDFNKKNFRPDYYDDRNSSYKEMENNFKSSQRNNDCENDEEYQIQKEAQYEKEKYLKDFKNKYKDIVEDFKILFINENLTIEEIYQIIINLNTQPSLTIFEAMNLIYREVQIIKTLQFSKSGQTRKYGPNMDNLGFQYEEYYPKNNLKGVIQKYKIYQNDEKEQKDKESIPEIWFFSDNSDKRRKLLKDEFGYFNYLPILNSTNENDKEDSIYSKNENELFYHYLYYKTLMCRHCNLSDKNQENDLCPYAHDILKDFRIIYDNKSEEIGAFMSKLLKSKLFNFENYLNYIPMSLSSEFNLDTFKVHMCQLDNNCPNDYHLCPYYHSSNEYDGPRRPHLLFCYTGNTGDICFNEKKKKYYPKKCNCGIFCQYLHSKNEYNYHPEHFRKIYQCTRKKEKGKCKYYKTCYGIHSNESNEATEEEQEEEYENIEEEVEGDEQVEEKKEKINNAFVVAKNFRCRKCQKVSDNGELIYFLKCKHFLCIKCFKKIAIKKKNLKDNEQFSFHCPFCEKIVEKDGAIKVEFAS